MNKIMLVFLNLIVLFLMFYVGYNGIDSFSGIVMVLMSIGTGIVLFDYLFEAFKLTVLKVITFVSYCLLFASILVGMID